MKDNRKIRQKFKEWQKNHKNPFTPRLEKYDLLMDGIIVEFQTSRAQDFFGITVLQYAPDYEFGDFKVINTDLSQSFHDKDHAEAYYDSLRVFISENDLQTVKEADSEEFGVKYNV